MRYQNSDSTKSSFVSCPSVQQFVTSAESSVVHGPTQSHYHFHKLPATTAGDTPSVSLQLNTESFPCPGLSHHLHHVLVEAVF